MSVPTASVRTKTTAVAACKAAATIVSIGTAVPELVLEGDALLRGLEQLFGHRHPPKLLARLVLRRLLEAHPPDDGDLGLLLAFSPGMNVEVLLLRWSQSGSGR